MEDDDKIYPWDKILPNQKFNSDLFVGTASELNRSIYETVMDVCGLQYPIDEFKLTHTPMFTIEQMASSGLSLHVLKFLINLTGAKRVLEIGAFIGVSAMSFAKALPSDGHVVTIEKFDHFAEIANKNFVENGLADKITLLQGDAFEVLGGLDEEKPFDFVFIDGDKERYADYFRMVEPLLSEEALVVIDDALFHGDVFNENQSTEKGAGVLRALEQARESSGYKKMFLPISNGVLMLKKNKKN